MLIGRAREQGEIADVLASAHQGRARALVLRGDPGIGKTSLLAHAMRSAEADGWFVLSCAGLAVEQDLDYAGLVTLVAPVEHRIELLADDHRQTLRAVLTGEPPKPLAVGVAVLHLLSTLAADRPLLVVLDEAQWLDVPSLTAVRFAHHRLSAERVALLAADRTDDPSDLPGLPVLRVGGLSEAASRELLATVAELAAPVVTACQERCAGNPLALVELARSLTPAQRSGRAALPKRLPLDEGLVAGLRRRIEPLPERTRRALVVVARGGRLRTEELGTALAAVGLELADLDPAEEAGVLRRGDGPIMFRHPLLREVAGVAPAAQVREAHRALASAVEGERRAWHLAEAGDADAGAAVRALTEAAERAVAQGAHASAASAWERAARLAPDDDEAARLLLAAGTSLALMANPAYAIPMLQSAYDRAPDELGRARAAMVLGDMLCWHESLDRGVTLLRDAAASVATRDVGLSALLVASAANFTALGGQLARAVELVKEAEALAEGADPLHRVAVRVVGTHLRLVHASAADMAEASDERLAELSGMAALVGPGAPSEVISLAQLVAFDLVALERWDEALDLLDRLIAAARLAGQLGNTVFALAMRGEVLFRRGRWLEARAESVAYVDHHLSLEEPSGSFGHATLARVEAVIGLGGAAAGHAAFAAEHGESVGMGILAAWGWHAQGLLALAEGRPHDAVGPLTRVWQLCRQGEIGNPGPLWWQGDLLAALLGAGQAGEARRLRRWLAEQAEVTGNRWAHAVVARADALLDHDVAQAERSVALLDELHAPFEAARSRLALACALDATGGDPALRQDALERALDAFERLGATAWSREARAALGGDTGEAPTVPLTAALSEAELRVALAVGRGLTNRQAATELAVSPKTVDAHLQSIYRKLNLRSRTELALLVARS